MSVVVTACAVFGLTIAEAKSEIRCLLTTKGGEVPFTVTAADKIN